MCIRDSNNTLYDFDYFIAKSSLTWLTFVAVSYTHLDVYKRQGQYPLPKKQILQLVESCDEILVLEDGQPFVEKQLKAGTGYNWVSEKAQLNLGFTYGDRFFNDKLGLIVSALSLIHI